MAGRAAAPLTVEEGALRLARTEPLQDTASRGIGCIYHEVNFLLSESNRH